LEPIDADQRQIADEHPEDELAEHGGLSNALRDVATDLGCGENDGEREHDGRKRIAVGCGRR